MKYLNEKIVKKKKKIITKVFKMNNLATKLFL